MMKELDVAEQAAQQSSGASNNSRRRWLVGGLVFLAVAAAAITTGVVVSNNNNDANDANNAESKQSSPSSGTDAEPTTAPAGSPTTQPSLSPTTKPSVSPSNLSKTCSLGVVISNQDACEDACERASCCGATNRSENCFPEDPLVCAEYTSSCGMLPLIAEKRKMMADMLLDDGDTPDPPDNLAAVCDWSNIGTVEGYNDCYDACDEGFCCVEGSEEDTCFIGKPLTGLWAHSPANT
jgi:hypothetical protein